MVTDDYVFRYTYSTTGTTSTSNTRYVTVSDTYNYENDKPYGPSHVSMVLSGIEAVAIYNFLSYAYRNIDISEMEQDLMMEIREILREGIEDLDDGECFITVIFDIMEYQYLSKWVHNIELDSIKSLIPVAADNMDIFETLYDYSGVINGTR